MKKKTYSSLGFKKKTKHSFPFTVFLAKIVFVILFIFFAVPFFKKNLAIDGCFCGPNSSCYPDGCTRKTIKPDGSIDYNLCGQAGCGGAYNACYDTNSIEANRYFCLNQPPCCEEMARRNDPEACCWPERGYCHPEYCKQVSRPEQCGWYWVWHDNIPEWMAREYGYGCVRGTSPQNLQPVFGLPEIAKRNQPPNPPPTNTPRPTHATPTFILPIEKYPIPQPPTSYSLPTQTPVFQPSPLPQQPPSNINVSFPFNPAPPSRTQPEDNLLLKINDQPVLTLGKIISSIRIKPKNEDFPDEKNYEKKPLINENTRKIIRNETEKILSLPIFVFGTIDHADKILEIKINSFLQAVIKLITNLIE